MSKSKKQRSRKTMREAHLAQVLILLEGPSHDEACDALSDLLTHFGIYGERTGVLDWSYRHEGGASGLPRPVLIPADFEPDTVDLNDLARGKGGAS